MNFNFWHIFFEKQKTCKNFYWRLRKVLRAKKLEIKKDGPNWDRQDIQLFGLLANVSKFSQI